MKTKIAILSLASILIFGCSSPTVDNSEKESNQPETVVESTEEEHNHDEHEAIVLDNGQKWEVVPEMLAFIRNMEHGVVEFSTKESPTPEEYQQLAILIDENIRELTSNCTMEGQAHDELHKWLVPFIGLSEEFDVATELTEQEKIYKGFEDAFVEFNTYFE